MRKPFSIVDATLVLFDIDGTLGDVRGAGRRAFAQALERVFGWKDDIQYIRFGGATDLDVLRRIMIRRGREPTTEDETAFFEQLPIELERTTAMTEPIIYPGVRDLLEKLSRDSRVLVGLVTGNIETCARIKLRRFDLHGHFVLGAFGHEHADRVEIARLALRRAQEHMGNSRAFAARFLVGDTPSDIAAAHAIDARSIAVATGPFDEASLREAGADYVLNDLADVPGVMAILGIA